MGYKVHCIGLGVWKVGYHQGAVGSQTFRVSGVGISLLTKVKDEWVTLGQLDPTLVSQNVFINVL